MEGLSMMQSKYFRTCLGIIALLLIIYLGSEISFLFRPIVSMFNMLIVPVAMAGFFYYLLRPIVDYLERRRIKRSIGVERETDRFMHRYYLLAFQASIWLCASAMILSRPAAFSF